MAKPVGAELCPNMLRALGYRDIERFNINEGHAALLTVRLLTDEAKKGGAKQ